MKKCPYCAEEIQDEAVKCKHCCEFLEDGLNNTIYSPLNRKEFRKQMSESFPAVYLTIISIIQGVALGFLCQNTFLYIRENPCLERVFSIMFYAAFSFYVIVIISFEYNWFIGIYRWSPKLRDALIPFSLGISQMGPIFFLDQPKWWWTLNASLAFVGALAFLNTFLTCKRNMFDVASNDAFKLCKNIVRSSSCLTFWISGFLTIPAILYHLDIFPKKILYWYWYEIFAFLVFAAMLYRLTAINIKFLKELHACYKLEY